MATSTIEAKGFLKKHVNAVHCSNSMSLMQRKAANVLLANAYNDLLVKDEFSIDVKTLCALMGFNSKNLSKLRDALKGLMTTAIEWGVLDNNSDIKTAHWKASTLLSSAEVVNGVCHYEYSNRIKKAFYYPDIFANINLKIQSQFKSSYGLALYENCARYKNIKQTPWLKLEEVKKILGAFGSAYDRYGNFKNRVLDVAIDEVNQKADFKVSLLIKKEGKAVIAIKFEIYTTIISESIFESAKILEGIVIDDKEIIIRSRLTNEFKVSPSIAEKLINEHGIDFIDKKMNILASLDSYKSGQIKNVPGALVDRINNPDKYIEVITSKKLVQEVQKAKIQKEVIEKQKQLEQDRINKEYTKYLNDSVRGYLEILSEYDIDDLNQNFLNDCKRHNNMVANRFKNGDKNSPMVKAIYNRFVVDNYLRGRVMSKTEFAKNG